MEIRFVIPELNRLDAIRCDALVLPFFSDDVPTQGALGLADWRLCGLISRMNVRKKILGSWLETVLLPGYPRLGMDKLILVGVGETARFNGELFGQALAHMLLILSRSAARISALVLPGRQLGLIEPVPAIEALLQLASRYPEQDELFVVDTDEAHRAMKPVLDLERRKARNLVE